METHLTPELLAELAVKTLGNPGPDHTGERPLVETGPLLPAPAPWVIPAGVGNVWDPRFRDDPPHETKEVERPRWYGWAVGGLAACVTGCVTVVLAALW